MMKFSTRGVVAVAMIAALGISAPAVATADTTTTTTTAPTTTTTTVATTTTTIHAGSNTPWKQWRKAENAYLAQLKVINKTFRATVDVARQEYWAAIKASKGSGNRQAARAAARAALTLSIANAMKPVPRRSPRLVLPRRLRPVPPVRRTSSLFRQSIRPIATQSPRLTRPSPQPSECHDCG